MASSPFSFDQWDAVLSSMERQDTSAAAPSPSPSLVALTPSTQSSGEFQAFTVIGSTLAGGESKKTYGLCVPSDMKDVCFGIISGTKFCLKDEATGGKCTVASHAKKFSPSLHAFHIKELETKAWCKPVYEGSSFTPEQRSFLLKHQLSRSEWDDTFNLLHQKLIPDWIKVSGGASLWSFLTVDTVEPIPSLEANQGIMQLTSPGFADPETGLFQLIPSLSYDSVELYPTDVQDETVAHVVATMNDRFRSIKAKWSTAFGEIEAGYLVVINDIKQLQKHLVSVKSSLGSHDSATSVWDQLGVLSSQVAASAAESHAFMLTTADTLEKVTVQCEHLSSSLQFFENEAMINTSATSDCLNQVDSKLAACEQRLARLLPILQNLAKQHHPAAPPEPLLREEIQDMQQRMDRMSSQLASRPTLGSSADLVTQVISLQAQVKLLQQRIVGDGVQIGSKVFQSFDDLRAWVPLKLPNRRYGLFVDAVSLLDFFTSVGHVDAEQTFTSFYSQKKTGFASMYEARVAASVQNLFPMVFGKSDSSGLDTSDRLPALNDPNKWDNGATGLKYQILRGMSDVEYQIESAIDSVLQDYDEARQIAKECLFKSKRFIMDLCNFMSQDYHKWMYRGHGKTDAWRMTAVSVRRVFEEMHSERVVARDGYDQEDQEFSAAKFLWATFKAHTVMAKYLKHQFYEHPAIAAVLARHLADNYVKPDEGQDARLRELEKLFQVYKSKVDSLISKENDRKKEKAEKQEKIDNKQKDKGSAKNDKGRQSPQVPPGPHQG